MFAYRARNTFLAFKGVLNGGLAFESVVAIVFKSALIDANKCVMGLNFDGDVMRDPDIFR